jgi:transposase InsO family protein
MDGKGRALDNIYIERFWMVLKYEHIYLNPANGGIELYEGVRKYIEFYYTERRHTSIKIILQKNILIQLIRIPKINLYLNYTCPE